MGEVSLSVLLYFYENDAVSKEAKFFLKKVNFKNNLSISKLIPIKKKLL